MANHKIMIIDNDENVLHVIDAMLECPQYETLKFSNATEALNVAAKASVDLVITDLKMVPMDGLEVLRRVKSSMPQVEVIILTAFATVETAIRAMKEGAFDYMTKPVKMDELRILVERALAHQRICQENRQMKNLLVDRYQLHNIIGKGEAIKKVFDLIEKVAPTDLTVLITGESGTGKELVARALHYCSPRKEFPFVAINCGAIPENLLESELFGHVRGAFTGAVANKKGLFAEADKGTLFLDEISATTQALQVSLLRVLEGNEFRKVGESKSSKVDVRIVAATNIDLQGEVKKQRFREDLYYRLSVVNVALPPLRERREDIPLLVEHFLRKYCPHSQTPKKLGQGVLYALSNYPWPGNVRELENILERAAAMSDGDIITLADLPENLGKLDRQGQWGESGEILLKGHLRHREKQHIEKILSETNQDKKLTAQRLGISLPSLYRKMEVLNIPTKPKSKSLG